MRKLFYQKNFALILLVIFVAFNSTDLLATKARMESLNQDSSQGSHYILDGRSIFQNPSSLNILKNSLVTEWGQATPTQNTKPNAEGGAFFEYGNFLYGLYLGSDVRSGNDDKSNFLTQNNRVDFFYAGDAGMDWGIRVFYADGKDEQVAIAKEAESYGLGLGITSGDLSIYSNFDLKNYAKGATLVTDKWEGDLGINGGVQYLLKEFTFFLEYNSTGFKKTDNAVDTDETYKKYVGGLAHTYQLDKESVIFSDLSFIYEDEKVTTTASTRRKGYEIPVTIGFESHATDWLVLRGSIRQAVRSNYDDINGKSKTNNDSASVAAGATITFKKLRIDGMIGTTSSDRSSDQIDDGVLATDNLLTKVGVSYFF